MNNEKDIEFLKLAIQKSKESFEHGNFPAGAVVVKDGEVISTAISSPYPGLFHADSKAITAAFEKNGLLHGASLYVGLENCLMCLGVAYWGGISDIYFAVSKSKVSSAYYETNQDLSDLPSEFNNPIRLHHISELEEEALQIIKAWEVEQKFSKNPTSF